MEYFYNLKIMILFLTLFIVTLVIVAIIIFFVAFAITEQQYWGFSSLLLIFVFPVYPTFLNKLYTILRL